MVIQSRRVWISGQFLEAALKVEGRKDRADLSVWNGKGGCGLRNETDCSGIYRCPYPWMPMDLTPMMPKKMVYETG